MAVRATLFPLFSAVALRSKFTVNSYSVSSASPTCSPPVRLNVSHDFVARTLSPPTSVYVHLPFCRKRCHYCDFPIVALGTSSLSTLSATDDDPRISNYVTLLCREIETVRNRGPGEPPLETVYFGGGTPSLVPAGLVSAILNALRKKFGLSSDVEISMEVDPGTFDEGKLSELKELGVNRVSVGVQAFQDELLGNCGRAHGLKEVMEAIQIVGACGYQNWSLDLISSLPHQTAEMWQESLHMAVKAAPTHISVYDLQVEQGTKFGLWYKPGVYPLPSENQSALFYRTASQILADGGYNHYEISSYCKNGSECKHNLVYWKNSPFYGFGLGSASYIGGVRFSRPKKLKEYMSYVDRLEKEQSNDQAECDLDARDLAMDVLMLSLRMARGLDVKEFSRAFGHDLVFSLFETFRPFLESGHVLALDDNGRPVTAHEIGLQDIVAYIRLSDPDGFLLSNELISMAFGVISP
ncbi:hypothetical protein H6P81_012436 [Aristolochia fimbriata]|uniref:Radical S-adenosyl methionine domain-containing protein 1, mitochondrial n=1 Tax=Aristolochia fimbriata TaxID=158543 RepID=A0AAV7EC41_ARIFI|nr:hypothetical protein H6P81_012436 [Aristolochia fimbriata]